MGNINYVLSMDRDVAMWLQELVIPLRLNVQSGLALSLGAAVFLSSCGGEVSFTDVTGTYAATVPYGAAGLVLNPNGTYSQTFKYTSGRVVGNSGTWTYGTAGNNSILLKNALTIGQNLGPPEYGLYREQIWSLQVESIYGKPFIEFGEGQGFTKVTPSNSTATGSPSAPP